MFVSSLLVVTIARASSCGAGTYASSTDSSCLDCEAGTYSTGSANETECTACPSAYFSEVRSSACAMCPNATVDMPSNVTTQCTEEKSKWAQVRAGAKKIFYDEKTG